MTKRLIIAGAPCAGKSTYLLENFEPGDLVFDYDTVHAALSGMESHGHREDIRPYVIAARDAIFAQLETHHAMPFMVITSSPKRGAVEALASRLSAEVVFLEVSLDEAHRRADLDERPEIWHSYIANWFKNTDFDPAAEGVKMARKTFKAAMEFKENGAPGEFRAVFASLNVVDLDEDVTETGAFREGQEVVIEPWNHSWDLPAGKGVVHADDQVAWVEGKFFLDTEAGRENYRTVKNLGPLAEWSYTFEIEKARQGSFEGRSVRYLSAMDVIGVSPVTRGAGIGTHTQSIKGIKGAIRSHETATSDSAWDGPANETRVKSGEDPAYYARIYAWSDPDGDPEVKSTYRFIHHEIGENGDPGAANVRACQTGIGVLNGARGGTTIPDQDRKGVYDHLARHLADAEIEAPELKSALGNHNGDDPEGEVDSEDPNDNPSGDLETELQITEIMIIANRSLEDG